MEIILLDRNGFSESLDGICALYSRAFTGTVSPDTLSHRFLDNPSGDLLASVAVDNGKIVAYFGALPSGKMFTHLAQLGMIRASP